MLSAPTRPYGPICTETFDLDWFERLTGFIETDYASNAALRVSDTTRSN